MITGSQSDRDAIRRQAMTALSVLLTGLGAVVLAAIFFGYSARAAGESYLTYDRVELTFTGPNSIGMGMPNPFLVPMNVTFTSPQGRTYVVPAFYDGNGAGGMDGNVWRVRYSPDEVGVWTYLTTSSEPLLNGHLGTFLVVSRSGCAAYTPGGLPDFGCDGRLVYVGGHYLKFSHGSYWLKGGVNEPEDFLAPGSNAGFSTKEDAIDYLASKGVNSIYFLTNNIDGDFMNVWPWVGATQEQAKVNKERFDIAKLAEWETLLRYIQNKGLVLHIVLEDDSGWTGFNRALYYREMVARFGYLNGLYWNIAEEYNENYTADQVKSFAQLLRDLDPYDHPTTVHQQGDMSLWDPFVGDSRFDLTSFQNSTAPFNDDAVYWFDRVEASGRTIPISFDESTRFYRPIDRKLFRSFVWQVYLGGANAELFTDLSTGSSYTSYDNQFGDMRRARSFVENMPFWEMRPANNLLTAGTGYVFTKTGEVYTVYLPSGGSIDLDLSQTGNDFDALWFDPSTGVEQPIGQVQGGQTRSFAAPDSQNDWVLLLRKVTNPAPPIILSTPVTQGRVGQLYLYDVDASGNPTPTFTLTSAPQGMVIDAVSGLISWMPAAVGTYPVTVQASNALGDDQQSFTVTVDPAPTPTDTPTPTVTSTGPADLIFRDGFEAGNHSAWSSSTTDSGDLSVNAAAALVGTRGMQALIDDNVAIFVTDDLPNAEVRYRARFYFDPNSIGMASGDSHYILIGYSGTSTNVMRMVLRFNNGVYQVRGTLIRDATTWAATSDITLSDAVHFIEVDWRAAAQPGANDGGLTLWVDGVQRANLTGIDNDTRRIDRVRLGAVGGIDTGTRGTYYFDAFEARRLTYIGPVSP